MSVVHLVVRRSYQSRSRWLRTHRSPNEQVVVACFADCDVEAAWRSRFSGGIHAEHGLLLQWHAAASGRGGTGGTPLQRSGCATAGKNRLRSVPVGISDDVRQMTLRHAPRNACADTHGHPFRAVPLLDHPGRVRLDVRPSVRARGEGRRSLLSLSGVPALRAPSRRPGRRKRFPRPSLAGTGGKSWQHSGTCKYISVHCFAIAPADGPRDEHGRPRRGDARDRTAARVARTCRARTARAGDQPHRRPPRPAPGRARAARGSTRGWSPCSVPNTGCTGPNRPVRARPLRRTPPPACRSTTPTGAVASASTHC